MTHPSRPERFEPPLLFDLDADPQEAAPLDPAAHALVLVTVARLRAAKEADINASFRSVTCYATLAIPVPRSPLESDPNPDPSPHAQLNPTWRGKVSAPSIDLCPEPYVPKPPPPVPNLHPCPSP